MKRTLLFVMVFVFVFSFASVALADTTGNNETANWNPPGPTYAYPGVAAAQLRGGVEWAPAQGSPHYNYSSTSNKCEVCHSPHQAGLNGGTGTSFKLLVNSTDVSGATDACAFCHVNSTLTLVDVYGGAGTIRGGHDLEAVSAIPDATWGGAGTLDCADCHTVHGAGAYDPNGALAGPQKILKATPSFGAATSPIGPALTYAEYCGGCHDMNLDFGPNDDSHILTADASAVGTTRDAFVAALPSVTTDECGDCHSAPVGTLTVKTGQVKWPHQSESIVGLGIGLSGTDVVSQGAMDDHCLKCHNNVGTAY